jgi:hypothetical protein
MDIPELTSSVDVWIATAKLALLIDKLMNLHMKRSVVPGCGDSLMGVCLIRMNLYFCAVQRTE